jgi:bacteriocin biosynthesis cyclodehydratase domain-containing protein
VEVFPASDGHLYLLASEDRHLRIRHPSPTVMALLARLDGRPVWDLLDELREDRVPVDVDEVSQALTALHAAELLEDADDDERFGLDPLAVERWDRQLRYFADLAPGRPRAQLQHRLQRAHVVILGMGGLGTWALQALTAVGVGRITAVDHDHVEVSNLSRQTIYRPADIGRPKIERAREWLAAFAPDVAFHGFARRLDGPEAIATVCEGADVVLGLADSPVGQIESWVNQACLGLGVPFITASQFPPLVRVGPLVVPGHTPCHACLLASVRREHPLFDELAAWRRTHSSPAATYAPACGLIGSLLANETVNILTGICEPATLGCALTVDLRTLQIERQPLVPEPGCGACASAGPRSQAS